jgi:hypothetical protein
VNDVHVDNDMDIGQYCKSIIEIKNNNNENENNNNKISSLPYIPKNRTEMNPTSSFHKSHKCELLLSQILVEA